MSKYIFVQYGEVTGGAPLVSMITANTFEDACDIGNANGNSNDYMIFNAKEAKGLIVSLKRLIEGTTDE